MFNTLFSRIRSFVNLAIVCVLWLLLALTSFGAAIPGSIPITAPIAPTDTADTFPSHFALYGKGGIRTVATIAERDAIPTARREEGMLVRVTADNSLWRLNSGLTTWREDSEIIEHVVGTGPGLVAAEATGSSAGTTTFRVKVGIQTNARWIRLWFTGWKNASGFEDGLGSSYTVKASVEVATNTASGFLLPVTFQGLRTITVNPKTLVSSDPIPISVNAGGFIFVRWHPNGTEVPITHYARHNWSGFEEGTGTGDVVDSGAISTAATATTFAYGGPVAVTGGVRSQDAEGFILMGDSITSGSAETSSKSVSLGSLQGWVARGLAEAGRPYIRCSMASELGSSAVASQAATAARKWAAQFCRYGVINYGSNDFDAGQSTNAILSSLNNLATELKRSGIRRVAASTILPRNASTDGFVSTNNQTLNANEATRVSLNALLLSGAAANVDVIWNPATYVTTGVNGQFWKTNYAAIISGVITSTPASTANVLYTGPSLAITNNQVDGWLVRFTSGVNAGLSRLVFQSWASGFLGAGTVFPSAPSAGDTLEVIPSYVDFGGVHPTSAGYDAMKAAVDVTSFVD